jgi:hypothetical protein
LPDLVAYFRQLNKQSFAPGSPLCPPLSSPIGKVRDSGLFTFGLFASVFVLYVQVFAQSKPGSSGLPVADRLRSALQSVVEEGTSKNGGLDNQEWAVIVNRDGLGCAVVFSGTDRSQEWLGRRVIAASKANTANGSSNSDDALSTSNLYAASQPGGSLYGLAASAPPNPKAFAGDPASFGTSDDPMISNSWAAPSFLAAVLTRKDRRRLGIERPSNQKQGYWHFGY